MKFALSPKKSSAPRSSASRSPTPKTPTMEAAADDQVSPELVPIVTLLSAQTHRRYHEGIFMLYNDLNGDGNPADREWKEVYGILTGNQLAYWDAVSLAKFKNSPEQLLETSSKPTYLNFTDAVFNAMKVLPAAKQQLENVIIVSTTLKNRFIIQLKSYDSLKEWFVSLRLADFEYSSLQEAYTGALLSARGSRLSDIRTILAEKRFPHSDWVKIRYGSGMAWRRCYAVIEPSQTKKKGFSPGRVLLYDSENLKKKSLLGVISSATSVTAVYPQSPFFIDKSTIMKLEGCIDFKPAGKKPSADTQETSLFIMPEQHSSVPGFDTLIRFLVPLFDSFGLYGRPKRLKADRVDPDSLVFGLPTLPHVHYLNSSDLYALTGSEACLGWDSAMWRENIKRVLKSKLASGYDGCGSSRGFSGAVSSLNSPSLGSPGASRVSSRTGPETSQLGSSFRSAAAGTVAGSGPVGFGNSSANGNVSGFGNSSANGNVSGFGNSSANGNVSGFGNVPRLHPEASASGISDKSLSFGLKSSHSGMNKNINNLQIETPNERSSVQLADIYQKYSTIEAPSDRFGDRNKMLNGSAEEIDEDHLPSLMRKKSLKNGPYPMSDQHLLNSDESADESNGSFSDGEEDLLAVPPIAENRNSSYSSVKSPLTQYNEFSKQFSKAVDQPGNYDTNSLSSEEAPNPPAHDRPFQHQSPMPIMKSSPMPIMQQNVPVIKQNSQMHSPTQHHSQPHTPSSGTKFHTEDFVQERSGPPKSQGSRQLKQALEGKPRYIQAPNRQVERPEQTAPLRVPQRPQQVSPNRPAQSSHVKEQAGSPNYGPNYGAQPQPHYVQASHGQNSNPGQNSGHGQNSNHGQNSGQNSNHGQDAQKYQNYRNFPSGASRGNQPQQTQQTQQPNYHRPPPQAQQQQAAPQNYQNRTQHRPPPPRSDQANQFPQQRQQQQQHHPQQQYHPQQQQYHPQKPQYHPQKPQYQPQYQPQPQQPQYQKQVQSPQPNQQQAQYSQKPSNSAPGARHPYSSRVTEGSYTQHSQTSLGLQAHSQPGSQNLRSYGDSNSYGYQAQPSNPAQPPRTDPRYQNQGYTRQY